MQFAHIEEQTLRGANSVPPEIVQRGCQYSEYPGSRVPTGKYDPVFFAGKSQHSDLPASKKLPIIWVSLAWLMRLPTFGNGGVV
jgi:hypothetical protein